MTNWVLYIDFRGTTYCSINQCASFNASHDPGPARIFDKSANKDIYIIAHRTLRIPKLKIFMNFGTSSNYGGSFGYLQFSPGLTIRS